MIRGMAEIIVGDPDKTAGIIRIWGQTTHSLISEIGE